MPTLPTAQSPRSGFISRQRLTWISIGLLGLIWILLFLPNLRTSPSWYGDETGTLLIGRELFNGETAIGALNLTYWHPYYPYQPGYGWVVGLFAAITKGDILGARFLNALIALAIALIIALAGRSRLGIVPAFFASAIFLTFPQSIIHFRWVYPHNAVALGFTIAAVYLLKPSRPRNNWFAGVGLAIAALAHPIFSYGAVGAFFCRLKRPRAWLPLAIPAALAVISTWTFLIIHYFPQLNLFHDLGTLASYYLGGSEKNADLLTNSWHFYTQNTFHLLSAVTVLLCFQRRLYPLAIFAGTLSILLLNNRQNLTMFYYQAIILTPILCLAWGTALATLIRFLRRECSTPLLISFVKVSALLIPLIFLLCDLAPVWQGKLIPRNQYWVTQNTREVEAAAKWLNDHTSPTDLVIANVNLAWLLDSKWADLIQATLAEGLPTEYFSDGAEPGRFRYSAHLTDAKYLVLGDIDQRYTLGLPNVLKNLQHLEVDKWPVVWSAENYAILENPHFSGEKSNVPPQKQRPSHP